MANLVSRVQAGVLSTEDIGGLAGLGPGCVGCCCDEEVQLVSTNSKATKLVSRCAYAAQLRGILLACFRERSRFLWGESTAAAIGPLLLMRRQAGVTLATATVGASFLCPLCSHGKHALLGEGKMLFQHPCSERVCLQGQRMGKSAGKTDIGESASCSRWVGPR